MSENLYIFDTKKTEKESNKKIRSDMKKVPSNTARRVGVGVIVEWIVE
jgi:hypothetical protein